MSNTFPWLRPLSKNLCASLPSSSLKITGFLTFNSPLLIKLNNFLDHFILCSEELRKLHKSPPIDCLLPSRKIAGSIGFGSPPLIPKNTILPRTFVTEILWERVDPTLSKTTSTPFPSVISSTLSFQFASNFKA